jgi:hypothetical protein
MKNHSLEIRVSRLKIKIENYAKNEDHNFILEPVSNQVIERLRALEYYPPDMLMILEQIGCMRDWRRNSHAMIDWWVPCPLEQALTEHRCVYELDDSNFKSPSSLLFFAYDCDANCYFYDTAATPWKLVVGNALQIVDVFKSKELFSDSNFWEGGDVISQIEGWII